jgi:TatD DNase family protein
MLIDSHVHLQDKKFSRDLDRVLQRAEDAGIEHQVCIGEKIESSRRALALARIHPRISAAAGVHPHYESGYSPKMLVELEALAGDPRVVAIGEIGLDYHYPNYDPARQKEMFVAQAHLAGRHSLPLVMHCRDAYDALLATIEEDEKIPRRGIVHCFSGNGDQARRFLDLGFHLGIGGAVTYPNGGELRKTIEQVGLDRIVSETDAPYLPPQRKRGRRNEPSYMKHTIKALADLTGLTYQDAARMTKTNAIRALGLPTAIEPEAVYATRRTLFVSVTDRCTNRCHHCARCSDYLVNGHLARLEKDPLAGELLEKVGDPTAYEEVAIGGLGEPTLRWDVCREVARELKRRGARVRLATNGLGSLTNGRDIAPEMAGLFDGVSVRMGAHDKATYNRETETTMPDVAFEAMLAFVERCKAVVPDVTLAVVGAPEVDIEACRQIAEERLQVRFQIREYRPNGYPATGCDREGKR